MSDAALTVVMDFVSGKGLGAAPGNAREGDGDFARALSQSQAAIDTASAQKPSSPVTARRENSEPRDETGGKNPAGEQARESQARTEQSQEEGATQAARTSRDTTDERAADDDAPRARVEAQPEDMSGEASAEGPVMLAEDASTQVINDELLALAAGDGVELQAQWRPDPAQGPAQGLPLAEELQRWLRENAGETPLASLTPVADSDDTSLLGQAENDRARLLLDAQSSPRTLLEALLRKQGGKSGQEGGAEQALRVPPEESTSMKEQSDSELLEIFENLENSRLRQLIETANAQGKTLLERRVSAEGIIDQLTGQQGSNDLAERLSTAAPLTQAGRAQPAASAAAQPAVTTINLPLEDSRWGDELAKRITFLMRGQVQQAEIRITPPELGPVNIRLNLTHDQASVSFAAQHQIVRDAIEQSLPRLREMLSDSGMQLANADVGSQFRGQQQQGEQGAAGDGRLSPALLAEDDDTLIELEQQSTSVYMHDRLVDFFA